MNMSTLSDSRAVVAPSADVERLRDPLERLALILSVLVNLCVVALALAVVFAEPNWLHQHPRIESHIGAFRAIAVAAIVAFPATFLGRHARDAMTRGGGVRVTPTQLPELFEMLVRLSNKLGLDEVPELYVGHLNDDEKPATVIRVHSLGRTAILLDADLLLDKQWKRGLDWISFVLAGQLGAIRLGHYHWWVEMLTAYTKRIPGLRTPLFMAWTYSRDRCAAWAVPDGLRGILLPAVGKDLIWDLDVLEWVSQPVPSGFWGWYGAMVNKTPHLLKRARALYDAGLFDHERDRACQEERRAEGIPT
jgi:hypothetical protein